MMSQVLTRDSLLGQLPEEVQDQVNEILARILKLAGYQPNSNMNCNSIGGYSFLDSKHLRITLSCTTFCASVNPSLASPFTWLDDNLNLSAASFVEQYSLRHHSAGNGAMKFV